MPMIIRTLGIAFVFLFILLVGIVFLILLLPFILIMLLVMPAKTKSAKEFIYKKKEGFKNAKADKTNKAKVIDYDEFKNNK